MPEQQPKIKILKKGKRKSLHRFYFTFNNLKSAALELAREIESDYKQDTPPDVMRFLEEFGRKV